MQTGKHQVVQVAAGIARWACRQLSIIEVGRVDAQRAHQFILTAESGIAMHTEGHLKRHAQPLFLGVIDRASRQIVDGASARIDIVVIIVLSFISGIHFVRHTGPLCPVAGTLQITGHTTDRASTLDIAHTSTETYGIGTDGAFRGALVAQGYKAIVILSLVELESSQIDPCAATHALVYKKLSGTSLVKNGVVSVGHGIRQRLIRHIHGISPRLGYVGYPRGQGLGILFPARRGGEPARTGKEGSVAIVIGRTLAGKSTDRRTLPRSLARLLLVIDASLMASIVVNNHLVTLRVAFAGSIDDGTGIFQHRNDVGHNKGLGKEVFGGAEERWTLPCPLALGILIVASMALPHGQMMPLQPLFYLVGTRCACHPRSTLMTTSIPQTGLFTVASATQGIGYEVLNLTSVGIQENVEIVHRAGQYLSHLLIDTISNFFRKRLIPERRIGIDIQCAALMVNLERIKFARADIGHRRSIFFEVIGQTLLYGAVNRLGLQELYTHQASGPKAVYLSHKNDVTQSLAQMYK